VEGMILVGEIAVIQLLDSFRVRGSQFLVVHNAYNVCVVQQAYLNEFGNV